MVLYYGPEKLEKLLESLFADDDELGLEDIVVLGRPIRRPIPFGSSSACCNYNYTGY